MPSREKSKCMTDQKLIEHLEFSDGHQIDVPPDDNVTAWELYGKHHGHAACLPHGRVRVVRHDMPAD
jgi:hypothetical protein